jgi:hypothetical protein
MYSIFFITSFLIGAALLFNRNNIIKVILLLSFVVLQGSFAFFVVKKYRKQFRISHR